MTFWGEGRGLPHIVLEAFFFYYQLFIFISQDGLDGGNRFRKRCSKLIKQKEGLTATPFRVLIIDADIMDVEEYAQTGS